MWIDDQIIALAERPRAIKIWRPEEVLVVCGRSNDPQREVYLDVCAKDQVNVLKRYGGGGTVVLHPGCVVLSVGLWMDHYYENNVFFQMLNQSVIDALGCLDDLFKNLHQDGLSDIVYEDKKVAGTSLFRSRSYLLYQASLLVDPCYELLERYLQHPSKEPDYRQNRSHKDFVTGLAYLSPSAKEVDDVVQILQREFDSALLKRMGHRLVDPVQKQISHLKAKIVNG